MSITPSLTSTKGESSLLESAAGPGALPELLLESLLGTYFPLRAALAEILPVPLCADEADEALRSVKETGRAALRVRRPVSSAGGWRRFRKTSSATHIS